MTIVGIEVNLIMGIIMGIIANMTHTEGMIAEISEWYKGQ